MSHKEERRDNDCREARIHQPDVELKGSFLWERKLTAQYSSYNLLVVVHCQNTVVKFQLWKISFWTRLLRHLLLAVFE